jgi:hypothetical protein
MNKKYPTFFLTWFNKFSRVPYPGRTYSHAVLAYKMSSFQMWCLTRHFMQLLVVKNLVVAFDPNGPKSNAPKEVPNFNLGAILLGKPFPKESPFPIETS